MNRADLLAAELDATMAELPSGDIGVGMRFLERLARLERVAGPEHRAVLAVADALRSRIAPSLRARIAESLDLAALEDRAEHLATFADPERAIDLGLEVLLIAELIPWVPSIDVEPILAWWEVAPAAWLPLAELAGHRWAHDPHPPPHVRRVLVRMSELAIAVLETGTTV